MAVDYAILKRSLEDAIAESAFDHSRYITFVVARMVLHTASLSYGSPFYVGGLQIHRFRGLRHFRRLTRRR
jgi:hypothetical protein